MWLRKGQQLKPNDLRWQSFYPHNILNTFFEFELATPKAQSNSTTVSANWLTYTLIRDKLSWKSPQCLADRYQFIFPKFREDFELSVKGEYYLFFVHKGGWIGH